MEKKGPGCSKAKTTTQATAPLHFAPGVRPTRRKRQRNRVYAFCGVVIMLCNVVMAAQTIPVVFKRMDPYRPLLASETLAIAAFGVAWLTKGKGLLKDR